MKSTLVQIDGVHYEIATVHGYLTKGKVKKLIERDGWEPVGFTPAIVGGFSLSQGMHTLRRRVTS